ncbi:DUF1365 domain-containing protein [Lacimicrobium alkaliphilum]|uniref:DUF1365 domain-containing protein n=1 Tax=Lacimicrobium alkaliphilum TaxID=1526571 RepID=A0ABQ1RFT8_9ALTE|nr:DUF1365 domain-containing protein [Lacimicrobium alkaliphilum]GGD66298.1 DUF1365 domain-containing protein [Lacimicrobium alkaliphilum]
MQSAIYKGTVWHHRHHPKVHRFSHHISLFWLDLENLERLEHVRGLSSKRWAPVSFRRSDYLTNPERPLHQAALEKMSALADKPLQGKVFMLGQLRLFGLYFSPVNFYYLQQQDGQFTHVLAEVSNTPWNERHYYLVDLKDPQITPKAFHVSPFNPMEMHYHWQISQPEEHLKLVIRCDTDQRHFDAGLSLRKKSLNSKTLFRVMLSTMTLKTLAGIYWHALRLFLKGVPVYSHTAKDKEQ